jgi:hypothetical protein
LPPFNFLIDRDSIQVKTFCNRFMNRLAKRLSAKRPFLHGCPSICVVSYINVASRGKGFTDDLPTKALSSALSVGVS